MIQSFEQSGCVENGVPTLQCFNILFSNILVISSAVVILILFVMFIMGSFSYLTALGNPEKIDKARGTLKYAVIGLVLFLASYLIITVIGILFGLEDSLLKFQIPEIDPTNTPATLPPKGP